MVAGKCGTPGDPVPYTDIYGDPCKEFGHHCSRCNKRGIPDASNPSNTLDPFDPLTDYGLQAKAVARYLTRAARHLQRQSGDRFWYEKGTQEACKLLFVRASDIRKENGIVYPD